MRHTVLHASYHCCVRVAKTAFAQIKAGHVVHFLHMRVANRDMENQMNTQAIYSNRKQYIQKLEVFNTFPIVHVHNEPNWLITEARNAIGDRHLVFDVHDLDSARNPDQPNPPEEALAFQLADAYVFPSKQYEAFARERFGDFMKDKPSCVVRSMVLSDMIETMPDLPPLGGLVLQGMVTGSVMVNGEPAGLSSYGYRDYRKFSLGCTKNGVPFTIYGCPEQHIDEYFGTGANVHESIRYTFLLAQLQRYDWGLCGGPERSLQREMGMPNKLWEYLAAGLPIIAYNAKAVGEFVQDEGLGVYVDSIESVIDVCKDKALQKKLKATVMEKRAQFCIENEVAKNLMPMYDKLMAARVPKPPQINVEMQGTATVSEG